MNNAEIVALAHQNLINTYGCVPLAFVRTGAYLYDADGNRYLDFFCGLAVTSLGHGYPRVVRAIKEQAEKLTHVSNVFHTEPMARLAARLCGHFGDGRVFFCNSGAEANEAALKLARRWGHDRGAGDYLKRVRDLCDRRKILLILDEVQTGMGRTGKLFAWQHVGIKPDIMTLAKALGGGLPIGAMIAKSEIAQSLTPGSHGSTFGGNPVSCAAALGVLDALEHDGAMENATIVGGYMLERLRTFAKGCARVSEVRGLGMMIGIVLHGEAKSAADACLRERLLVNATAENVLRLLPPLTLTRDEADAGLKIIERALSAAPAAASAATPTATR